MKIKKPKLLLISILLTQGSGIIGSFATISSVSSWYLTITKPSFNPPSWIFGPVWTTLFFLMAISLYIIWVKGRIKLVKLFIVHLFFNILWSYLFFGLQNPGLALIEIIFLLIFIAYLAYTFYKVDKWAGILLLPYLLWGSFATFLNYSIWRLN
jgi:tryptophan-rich sensory protein